MTEIAFAVFGVFFVWVVSLRVSFKTCFFHVCSFFHVCIVALWRVIFKTCFFIMFCGFLIHVFSYFGSCFTCLEDDLMFCGFQNMFL